MNCSSKLAFQIYRTVDMQTGGKIFPPIFMFTSLPLSVQLYKCPGKSCVFFYIKKHLYYQAPPLPLLIMSFASAHSILTHHRFLLSHHLPYSPIVIKIANMSVQKIAGLPTFWCFCNDISTNSKTIV